MFKVNYNKTIFSFCFFLLTALIFSDVTNTDGNVKKNIIPSYTDSSVLNDKSKFDTTDNLANEKHIYESKCKTCHPLFQQDEFTGKDWKNILIVMSVKSKLTDEEYKSLLKYFSDQSNK